MSAGPIQILLSILMLSSFSYCWQTNNYQRLQSAAAAISSHNLADAESELRAILADDPKEHRAENFLGVVFAERGRDPEAEQQFRRALADPRLAGARVNLALLLERQKHLGLSADYFEEACKIDPTREDSVAGLARVLRSDAQIAAQQGNNEKALADLLRARKYAPRDPDLLYDFGVVALRQSLYDDASAALQSAVELRPSFAAAWYALGRAQIGTQRFPEAETSMIRYNQLRPNDPTALYGLGLVASLQQRNLEARDFFEHSLKLQPAQTESWYELGFIDLEAKDLPRAEEEFRRALARNPKHATALLGLGQVLFQRRDFENARRTLESALQCDPKLFKAHYYLGLALSKLGDKEDSAKELKLANEMQQEEQEKSRVRLRLLGGSEIDSHP